MALDPRTRMAQARFPKGENALPTTPLRSQSSTPETESKRPMTAKRRQLHALTEALFDPFSTMQEADLEALMLMAKRRTPKNRPGTFEIRGE